MTHPDPVRRPWGWLLVVAVLIGTGLLVWWGNRVPVPSRQEAESSVASAVGQREHTTVTANCDEPTDAGFACRLRDAAGRYGSSSTSISKQVSSDEYAPDTISRLTSWDFPIDSAGNLRRELVVAPPQTVSAMVFGTVLLATLALGPGDPGTRLDCPDPDVGASASCAAAGKVRSGTLQRTAADHYLLTATFALPG